MGRSKSYTPILAALQFCIRVISLEHCLPQATRDNYVYNERLTLEDVFRAFHGKWLVDEQAVPFTYVHQLLN